MELGKGLEKTFPSIQQAATLELKQLPANLRYVYLGEKNSLLVIISNSIIRLEEDKLLRVLGEEDQPFSLHA